MGHLENFVSSKMSYFENGPLRKFGDFEKASFRKWVTSKIDSRSDRFGSDLFPKLPLFLSLHNTINFHSTKNKINVILALFLYARSVVYAYFNYLETLEITHIIFGHF